jgi:anti-anti-sigma regulatory factor
MRAAFHFVTCAPPSARIRIAGDLDLDSGDDLEDVLESLEDAGCTQVELDLDALTFIDLPVLDLLRHEQRRLRVAGGGLRVVAASAWFADECVQAEVYSLLPDPTALASSTGLRPGA